MSSSFYHSVIFKPISHYPSTAYASARVTCLSSCPILSCPLLPFFLCGAVKQTQRQRRKRRLIRLTRPRRWETRHIKICRISLLFLPLTFPFSTPFLQSWLVFLLWLFGCSPFLYQAVNEEEEKVEDGMWEETFKSHSDSKPNGESPRCLVLLSAGLLVVLVIFWIIMNYNEWISYSPCHKVCGKGEFCIPCWNKLACRK